MKRLVVAFLSVTTLVTAFAPSTVHKSRSKPKLAMASDDSRRNFFGRAFVGTSMGLWAIPNSAISKESAQDISDKEKISKGLHRLNYLLENWESETTICNTSNDNPYIGCERTPMKVMDVSFFLSRVYRGFSNPVCRHDSTACSPFYRLAVSWLQKYE
jgi:hypothetical protein